MSDTNKGKKVFSRAPDLSAILNSDSAKNFIGAGEATGPELMNETKKIPIYAKSKKLSSADDGMSWMTADPSLRVQHIIRLPAPLKHLIEFLGDTGKGLNQTTISVAGMTAIAEALAKERGLPLPKSWGTWLNK